MIQNEYDQMDEMLSAEYDYYYELFKVKQLEEQHAAYEEMLADRY